MSKLRTHAPLVVALLALFFAIGGPSFGADAVNSAVRLITGKNVKDNSLTTKDIKNGSLLKRDFKAGQLPAGPMGPGGPSGSQGPRGDTGAAGTSVTSANEPAGSNCANGGSKFTAASGDTYACNGSRGPSDAYYTATAVSSNGARTSTASLPVPAGAYAVQAKAVGSNFGTTRELAQCALASAADPGHDDNSYTRVPTGSATDSGDNGVDTLAAQTVFNLPSGGTITWTCTITGNAFFPNSRLTAVQVDAIHRGYSRVCSRRSSAPATSRV